MATSNNLKRNRQGKELENGEVSKCWQRKGTARQKGLKRSAPGLKKGDEKKRKTAGRGEEDEQHTGNLFAQARDFINAGRRAEGGKKACAIEITGTKRSRRDSKESPIAKLKGSLAMAGVPGEENRPGSPTEESQGGALWSRGRRRQREGLAGGGEGGFNKKTFILQSFEREAIERGKSISRGTSQ